MRREVSIWPLTSDAEDALREVVAGKRTEALCFPVVPQTLRICGDGTDTDDCTGMVAEPMS